MAGDLFAQLQKALDKANFCKEKKDISGLSSSLFEAAGYARQISDNAYDKSIKQEFTAMAEKYTALAQVYSQTDLSFGDNRKETKIFASPHYAQWDDIKGLANIKEEIELKIILPLQNPEITKLYKVKPAKTLQVMLYGPPGTGKTMFAEALAGRMDMKLFRKKASEIIDPHLGMSLTNLNAFITEVKNDPEKRLLIFIDEFDAIAGKRTSTTDGASAEMSRLVNELLQQVDDLVKSNLDKLIVFIVTTNLPWNIDSALLRGKRFDTQIYIGLPDKEAVAEIVRKQMGHCPMSSEVSLDYISNKLVGYTPADITSICDKITDKPMMKHYKTKKPEYVTKEDIDTVIGNYRKSVTPEMLKQYDQYRKEGKVTLIE